MLYSFDIIGNSCSLIINYMESSIRGLYFTQKIKNLAYNFGYKARAYLDQYQLEEVLTAYQTAYLLGKQYTANSTNTKSINQTIAKTFKEIVWITYRSGFPELLKSCGENSSFVTDTGWGCMIRVGQMLFAQILQNYLKTKTKDYFTTICQHFNDFKEDAVFSIQRIAKVGKQDFDLKPGEWYNPSQIAYILSDLLNETKAEELSNLKSLIFNNASLFFDELVQTFQLKGSKCIHEQQNNQKQWIVCEHCKTSNIEVAVILLVRIGLTSPQPQYLKVLDQMITLEWFKGIIGGIPKRALYFVGRKDDEYIYLDPHYVQKAKQNTKQNTNSYFCQSFRKCKNTTIDPSLGICFYLHSIKQLNCFYRKMWEMKKSSKDFFIYVDDETPSYLKRSQKKQKQKQSQFITLGSIYNQSGEYM